MNSWLTFLKLQLFLNVKCLVFNLLVLFFNVTRKFCYYFCYITMWLEVFLNHSFINVTGFFKIHNIDRNNRDFRKYFV